MPKLILDLVEGGSIAFERQDQFLVVTDIKDNKETVLGLLRRADFGHLHSFIQSEMFVGTMQAAHSVPSFEESMSDTVRKIVKEFRKQMGMDQDEESEDELPK